MSSNNLIQSLAGFAIFADLSTPELEAIVHTFDEQRFAEGQRVLRQGFTGSGFFVILDGEASIRIDGEERARLGRGDGPGQPLRWVLAGSREGWPGLGADES